MCALQRMFNHIKCYAILFTARERRDTFLAEVFLWYTPFLVALSSADVAAVSAVLAASLSLASIAAYTFLTAVLTPDLIDLFLSAFVLFTKILFFADLILAMITPPIRFILSLFGRVSLKPDTDVLMETHAYYCSLFILAKNRKGSCMQRIDKKVTNL